jgi:hypothetical protein
LAAFVRPTIATAPRERIGTGGGNYTRTGEVTHVYIIETVVTRREPGNNRSVYDFNGHRLGVDWQRDAHGAIFSGI